MKGGFTASIPFWGRYGSFDYVNWSNKFFIDSLILYEKLRVSRVAEQESFVSSAFGLTDVVTDNVSYMDKEYLNRVKLILKNNQKVLDIGAGKGTIINELRKQFDSEFIGIDPVFEGGLVKRGSITFFIDPVALTEKPEENKRGRPRLFSHPLIHLLLVLKIQYRLTYRTLEGFAKSILPYIQADIFLPTYSLICKRASKLEALLPKLSSRRPKVVLIDATGIKVYGEGEWKVKIHGASKRRTWIKLHIAVDEKTQEIIHLEITNGHEADCKIGPKIRAGRRSLSKRNMGKTDRILKKSVS
jgi:hypothetical protein